MTSIIPADPRLLQGALAEALAKAQSSFPSIPRDKEVTVQTKSGGSYKFKYAPLDSILNAVRMPLADNGLAITQTFDEGDLITSLLHKDGGAVSSRIGLPDVDGVQALGSAITYLRRYSIQAILGIAAEEDDDGNTAAGNTATFRAKTPAEVNVEERERLAAAQGDVNGGGLIGTAIAQGTQDFELRQSPDGYTLPFRVKDGAKSFIVLAEDKLAEAIEVIKPRVIGQRVTVWGHWTDETIPAKSNKPAINYRVLHLERIETPDGILPPEDIGPEPPSDVELAVPLFPEADPGWPPQQADEK